MGERITKEQFISDLQQEIERAVMQAQGIMDWIRQKSPDEIAKDVAEWLPDCTWSELEIDMLVKLAALGDDKARQDILQRFARLRSQLVEARERHEAVVELATEDAKAYLVELVEARAKAIEECRDATCRCCAAGHPPNERNEHWVDFNGREFAHAPRMCKAAAIIALATTSEKPNG